MHLRLGAASEVVSDPLMPDGASKVFRNAERFVPGDRTRSGWLPRLGVLAGWNDSVCASAGDSLAALPRVAGTVRGDRSDLRAGGDLVQQPGQHRRVTDMAASNLDRTDFQRRFADAKEELAPQPAFRAAMHAGVPLAFALCLYAGAVDQKVQRPLRTAAGNVRDTS